MYKYLLAAVAAAAIASPAAARDGQAYVGVEGGLTNAQTADFDTVLTFPDDTAVGYENAEIDFKRGVDLDAIVGYDFGMFRLEGELAWKSIHTKDIGDNVIDEIEDDIFDYYELDPADGTFEEQFGADGDTLLGITDHATILSLMGNALIDFETAGLGFYAGVGAGRARVKMMGDRDNAWAYQGILGLRAPISERVDLGLKYRYFRTGRLNFGETLDNTLAYTGDDFPFAINARGRLVTHSLLASLIFNLGGAAAAPVEAPMVEAPPPPPPPPATQTCPDGSVILATEVCPAPPPPPPAPAGERG